MNAQRWRAAGVTDGAPVRVGRGTARLFSTARADETVPAAVFGSLQRM
jgi:hypothetical protein